jgi:hypothetical protein
MMMSKPQEAAKATVAQPKQAPSSSTVADLERRLAMIGDDDPPPPMEVAEQQDLPSFAAPPQAVAAATPPSAGKSALLVSNVLLWISLFFCCGGLRWSCRSCFYRALCSCFLQYCICIQMAPYTCKI